MTAVEGTAWEHDVKARLIARDSGALTEMYDQFGSYVFGLAARVIGDRRAAEDVTQDVDGDADLARDLVSAANAFAGL